MASQLVYTSAAKLLDAGRSGFGTVARSKSISPMVVSAIERVSQFANMRGLDRSRVIFVHRRITAGSNRFHILSRIVDAGADYTGRTNHLAHHLVISQEEAVRAAARSITPADVLQQFQWLGRWDGNARFLEVFEDVPLEAFTSDGLNSKRQLWSSITGNSAHARLLAWDGAPRTGVLIIPGQVNRLALLAESLIEFGAQSWSRTFTTSLETTDELSELEWIITTPSGFEEIQSRCGSRPIFNLATPAALPIPPAPVVPSPSIAPQTSMPDAPAIHRTPDLVTITPSTNAINVRVRSPDNGSSTARKSLQPAITKTAKKKNIMLLAALTIFILAATLLLITILKHDKSEGTQATQNESTEDKNLQEKIIVKLGRKCGIEQGPASEFAKSEVKSGEKWENFVVEADRMITNLIGGKSAPDQVGFEKLLSSHPKGPEGYPAWLTSLWEGVRDLSELQAMYKKCEPVGKDENFSQHLVKLHQAVRNLVTAGEGMPSLKNADPELFCYFVKPRIEKAVLNLDKDILSILFDGVNTCWQEKRGEEILKIFGMAVSKITDEQKKQILKLLEQNRSGLGDRKYAALVDSINQVIPKQGDVDTPKDNQINKPTQPPEKPGEDTVKVLLPPSNAPARQVIIIPNIEELKKGVPVELLKEIIPAASKKKIDVKGFKVVAYVNEKKAGGSPGMNEVDLNKGDKLHLSDADNYYCSTLKNDPEAPKYYADGRFSLIMENISMVKLSYENKNAYIVVEPQGDPVAADLAFQLRKESDGKNATVVSSNNPDNCLMGWIKSVPEEQRLKLEIKINPHQAGLKIKMEKGILVLEGIPPEPTLRFSEKDGDEVKSNLKNLEGKWGVASGPQAKKMEAKNERASALATLKESICIGIGGSEMRLKLGIKDNREIEQDQAIKLAKDDSYEVPNDPKETNEKKKENVFRKCKCHFGSKELDRLVTSEFAAKSNSKYKTWIEIENNRDSLYTFTKGMLDKSDKYKPWDFDNELEKVRSISISTHNGRKIFEATRE